MSTRCINGADSVGRFSVELELANYGDLTLAQRGLIPDEEVRRLTIQGLVDTGATKLVLPQTVVEQLGLQIGRKISVRYADGHTAQRDEAEAVFLELLGRYGTFSAVVEPDRTTALVGAIVLEDLDLLVDCQRQQVVPRDPHGAIFEIE